MIVLLLAFLILGCRSNDNNLRYIKEKPLVIDTVNIKIKYFGFKSSKQHCKSVEFECKNDNFAFKWFKGLLKDQSVGPPMDDFLFHGEISYVVNSDSQIKMYFYLDDKNPVIEIQENSLIKAGTFSMSKDLQDLILAFLPESECMKKQLINEAQGRHLFN